MRRTNVRTMLLGALGWAVATSSLAQTTGPAGRPAAPPANRPPAQGQGGAPATAPNQAAQRAAAPMPAPPVVPDGERKMEQLLVEWEKRSQQDETLHAEFTRVDKLTDRLDPLTYDGVAMLMRPSKACLEFRERVKGVEFLKGPLHERIVATGENVYHITAQTKQVFVYPLDPDARRRALEQGPLPFIFNFRREEAKQRYAMYLIKETPKTDTDPATVIIDIRPRAAIDQEEFSRALVQLDLSTFLPKALQLISPNGKDTRLFLFQKVMRNGRSPATNPANFDGKRMAAEFQRIGYKVVLNPDNTGMPAPPPAAVGTRPPGIQPPADGRRR